MKRATSTGRREGLQPEVARCLVCAARPLNMCGGLAAAELAALLRVVRCESYGAGEPLFRQGDASAWVFNITDGVIRLSSLLDDGRRQVVGLLFPGDFLGFADGGHHRLTAEAVHGAKVCRFARSDLAALGRTLPQLERRLLEMAARDLVSAQEHIVMLGRRSAVERFAAFLLMLSNKAAARGGAGNPVHLPTTREDIADYLGLAFETVSRCLTRLEAEGLIAIASKRVIRLRDRDALEAYRDAP